MKLKTITVDGATYAVIEDGKPVYEIDGKDIAFDAPAAREKITTLNGEAQGHRLAKESAEAALKKFDGITDPVAAIKALETMSNIDAGQLVAAGKVEEIRAAAKQAAEQQVAAAVEAANTKNNELTALNATLKGQLDGALIGGAFTQSKFVTEKVAVPVTMLQKTYGDNFNVEDGKLVPYDTKGDKLWSRAKPGELADFDEALDIMISSDPYKDHILRGQTKPGGGQGQPNVDGSRTMTRSAFQALPPGEQMKAAGEYQIVDN